VDVRSWTQRYLGYALTGLVTEQKFAFWVGKGGNGKNVCADVVIAALGEYAMVGAPDLLLEKHGEGHPTELADIEGQAARRLLGDRAGPILGRGAHQADHRRQDHQGPPHETGLLRVRGDGKARRTREHEAQGAQHGQRPLAPHVFAAVDCADSQARAGQAATHAHHRERAARRSCVARARVLGLAEPGLGEPRAIVIATDDYRQQEDVLGLWVSECCRIDEDAWTGTTALYENYKAWCKDEGIDKPWTLKAWKARLIEREGISVADRNNARGLRGIRITEEWERGNT
jgi:putative DNA primase/helicase